MPIYLLTWQGVKAQGAKEGKDSGGGKQSNAQDKKDEPPAPTPAKREDVVFDVTDKTVQKVGAGFCLGFVSGFLAAGWRPERCCFAPPPPRGETSPWAIS